MDDIRHEYAIHVSVKCRHGRRRCRPADEIIRNLVCELLVVLAPHDPRVDVESYCAFGGAVPLRLDGEVVP